MKGKKGFFSKLKDGFKELGMEQIGIKILTGGRELAEDANEQSFSIAIKDAILYRDINTNETFVKIATNKRVPYRIIDIEWEESVTRSAGKAAMGAIAGTVVAGPIGTIAGAAIGGRKRDQSRAFVYLENQDGKEFALHIECSKDDYTKIANMRN